MDESKKKPQKAVVETYASDMADVLHEDAGGTIRKIIEDEEARENEKKKESPESRQNKVFIAISAILVLLGLAVVLSVWKTRSTNTIDVGKEFTPLIFTDKSVFPEIGDLKGSQIIQTIRSEADIGELKPGGIKGIYLTSGKQLVGLRQFLSLLGISFVPGDPVLVHDSFLIGAVKTREENGTSGKGLALLVQMRTTADIFENLRSWEGKMLYDLRDLFGIPIDSENNYLLAKKFEDGLVENKNARLLTDKEGKLVLLYVFADNNSVVIADSAAAAREVMLRLAAKQTKE